MSENLDDRFAWAQRLAIEGGNSTLEYFQRSDLEVEKKGDQSPVTVADRNTEQWIRRRVAELFPEDAVIGEEFGETPGSSGFRWILDPIDGTKSFIRGVPLFGTMIGIEKNGQPEIGAIFFPGLNTGIYGCQGKPTVHGPENGLQEASVSRTTNIEEAVFVTSEVKSFAERSADAVYRALEDRCYLTRTWGDCYGYYLVATGRADLMVDPKLNIWDAAAVAPILRGAGGAFVDWAGVPRIDGGESIGATPAILETVLKITRPFAGKFN